MNKRTFSGRNLDEALEAAVREYKKPREALSYRKLEEKKTLFGLEKTVVIEVLEDEVSPTVRTALNRIILSTGLSLTYHVTVEDDLLIINLSGVDLGLVLKNHGEVLDAIQTLVARIVQRQGWEGGVEVDGDSFRVKLREKLQRQALDLCDRARRENRSFAGRTPSAPSAKDGSLDGCPIPRIGKQKPGQWIHQARHYISKKRMKPLPLPRRPRAAGR